MSVINQITFRAPDGGTGSIRRSSATFGDNAQADRWRQRLDPWLRTGKPLGRAYLNFGSQAAFIRWYAEGVSPHDWEYAVVLAGEPDLLTATYALELPDLDRRAVRAGGGFAWTTRPARGPGHDVIEARARSAGAVALLVPLLAHALRGERRVTMPWTEPWLPEAVMWGLVSILEMIGDTRPVSFFTYAAASARDAGTPGLLVSFRPGARMVPPDPGYEALAGSMAARFADSPAELRRILAQHGMLKPADDAGRIAWLLGLGPRLEAGNADAGGKQAMNDDFRGTRQRASARPSGTASGGVPDGEVRCPICLHKIRGWDTLDTWRWDPGRDDYVELRVPPDLNEVQLLRHVQGAYVRCPKSQGDTGTAHFLPVNYGRYSRPVLLGFVGLTKSGKTHLLASMVGAIENNELQEYGVTSRPLDYASHRRFLRDAVEPFLNHGRQLPGTQENVVMFADAFLMSHDGGPDRPVILFDIAGGDLARVNESKEFLWVADGLFFVIDPDLIGTQRAGDETFSNVLSVVDDSGRRDAVNAAIVLNKADKLRFDEPVARWLRAEGNALKAEDFLRESADVYAYLYAKKAGALTTPYQRCDKATLHVASPAGGASEGEAEDGAYPRGVTPRRVLRPLAAMLAMTGVLTGPEAEKVGV